MEEERPKPKCRVCLSGYMQLTETVGELRASALLPKVPWDRLNNEVKKMIEDITTLDEIGCFELDYAGAMKMTLGKAMESIKKEDWMSFRTHLDSFRRWLKEAAIDTLKKELCEW